MFNPRDQWLPIRDPERLSRVLTEIIDSEFEGSFRRAACHVCEVPWPTKDLSERDRKAINATRMQIQRLIQKGSDRGTSDDEFPRISFRHVRMVARLLGDRSDDFAALFSPEEVARSLLRYEDWLAGKARQAPVVNIPMGELSESISRMATSALTGHAIRELRSRYPELFQRLDRALTAGGHSQSRANLAFQRIVEPIVDHIRTGGIERGLAELEDAELKRYVRATIRREEILLDRTPDWERAHEAQELFEEAQEACINATKRLVDPRAFVPGRGAP